MNSSSSICYAIVNHLATPQEVPCNNVVGSPNLYKGTVEYSSYGYNLTAWAVYLFTALNAFAAVAHLAQGIYWRTYWSIPTLFGGALVELIGWAGRIWSIKTTVWDPNNGGYWYSNYDGFLMQIVCLVIAPTFFSAGNYVLLNRLIRLTGGRYSSITPDSFTLMFVVADILCIVIQAAGGGIAGTADDLDGANTGAYIMTGGVCLQLFVTVLFAILYFEFIWRYSARRAAEKQYDIAVWFKCGGARTRSRNATSAYRDLKYETAPMTQFPDTRLDELERGSSTTPSATSGPKEGGSSIDSPTYAASQRRGRIVTMIWVLGFATLLITVRGVYRSVELTNGWVGPIAVNETLFLTLDSLLMALLILAYVVYHPGLALGKNMK